MNLEQDLLKLATKHQTAKGSSAEAKIRAILARYGIQMPIVGEGALCKPKKGAPPPDAILPPTDTDGPNELYKKWMEEYRKPRRKSAAKT